MRLMMSDFEVHIPDDSVMHDFLVAFPGPVDTPYEGGTWKVHVTLPKEYPYKSPSIGFENRMFHPNVDEMSGSVCLDVINQTWSPMFDLVNIFTLFLPQLLRYPNPTDPLNGEAASLMMRDPEGYGDRIRECVRLYASKRVIFGDEEDGSGGGGAAASLSRRGSAIPARRNNSSFAGSDDDAPGSSSGGSSRKPSMSDSAAPSTVSASSSDTMEQLDMDDSVSDVSDMSDIGT